MKKKKYLAIILLLLICIQFIRIDKSMPATDISNDFINLANPPEEIANMIKTSCYDCHSYQVKYPWYAEVAPISWYIKHHVNEGLERVNFSNWTAYSDKKVDRKLEACAETIELENMPLSSYTFLHKATKLSKEQRTILSNWLKKEAENQK